MVEHRYKDLTGQTFGKLTVISIDHFQKHERGTKVYWLCKCSCGKYKIARSDCLKDGGVKSCGCAYSDRIGSQENWSRSRLYSIYKHMVDRCYNKKNKKYYMYGGKGIEICDEWKNSFKSFKEWSLCHEYNNELTIDRIDGDKGYSPNNCRWVSYKEQNRNLKTNVYLEYGGKTMCLTDWLNLYKIRTGSFHGLMKRRGFSYGECLQWYARYKFDKKKREWIER